MPRGPRKHEDLRVKLFARVFLEGSLLRRSCMLMSLSGLKLRHSLLSFDDSVVAAAVGAAAGGLPFASERCSKSESLEEA